MRSFICFEGITQCYILLIAHDSQTLYKALKVFYQMYRELLQMKEKDAFEVAKGMPNNKHHHIGFKL